MCLILMQSLHVHVHAHGTSVSILVGEHFCFLSLQLLSTSFYGESCIFSVDSWCSQYTGSGNYCQISTTRQAAMLKHKCMKPVLSAQILMYSFYQRFQSHFTSVMSVARFCCSTPMAHQKLGRAISKLWSVGSNEDLTQATMYSPVTGLVRHSLLETFDEGCAIPSFCRQTCTL